MLGAVRRRPCDSSLEVLELERSAGTKTPKSDALSIYEATLQKLRLGSRRAFATRAPTETVKVMAASQEDGTSCSVAMEEDSPCANTATSAAAVAVPESIGSLC